MTDNKEREALHSISQICDEDHASRDYLPRLTEIRGIARAALAASQEKAEPVALGFRIELRGACHVVVWHDDSCRPASDEEIALWNRAAPVAAQAHPDDAAVDRFAIAMKEKLAIAREKGRSGWENMDPAELSLMLRQHVEKGDPRDVANFCMFLWALRERIGDSVLPYGKRAVAAQASKPVAFEVRRADGSPLAVWEPCTRELYDATLKTGRYAGFENGPPSEVRALCVAPQPSAEAVRDAMNALPTKPGVYAWSAGTANALVLVNRRPSSHSPGGVLNGHVIESTKFYDGCPVTAWGKDGRWVLLHDFDARAQGEQAAPGAQEGA